MFLHGLKMEAVRPYETSMKFYKTVMMLRPGKLESSNRSQYSKVIWLVNVKSLFYNWVKTPQTNIFVGEFVARSNSNSWGVELCGFERDTGVLQKLASFI